ncbi:MAG: hypothetical protein R2848_08805 [Thermomicrobiales bacterium]
MQLSLSPRSYHRVLKLARTIADLAGEHGVSAQHLAEATVPSKQCCIADRFRPKANRVPPRDGVAQPPRFLTSFLGRDRERGELRALF